MKKPIKTFSEAVKFLDIEKYSDDIIHSHSKGELFHLVDYIEIANALDKEHIPAFKQAFEANVNHAKQTWERPESVYQHVLKFFNS